jgi:myo-inositol-1(or 4)-monophosphatase
MPFPPDTLHRISHARQAVLAQTELLHREFGRTKSEWKSDGTRVTAVDLAISQGIMKSVLDVFPCDQFFSEELSDPGAPIPVTAPYSWVLDPIDGTNNYALGIAYCSIGLALLKDGMPVYGFVYDMSRRKLIHGGPGVGVIDGDQSTRVRTEPLSSQALIGFHSPYDRSFGVQAQRIVESYKIRGLGSSTLHLAYVAAGILDGVVDHNVKLWDIASAVPLVWAAGGETRFLNGDPFPMRAFDLRMKRIFYVAGSTRTCDDLLRTLGVAPSA